jgi:hypothetical protein
VALSRAAVTKRELLQVLPNWQYLHIQQVAYARPPAFSDLGEDVQTCSASGNLFTLRANS